MGKIRTNYKKVLFVDVNFTGARLHYADLRKADLSGTNIKEAKLKNAIFDETTKLPFSHQDAVEIFLMDKK